MNEELFLIARIGGRGVAIDATQVDSVVDIPQSVPVPGAPRFVVGLTALRSRVITVIDTLAALGLAEIAKPAKRAVIGCIDGHHYALTVDQLEDVMPLARLPLPTGLALDRAWAGVASGMVEREGEALLIVDLHRIVPRVAAAA